MKVLEVQNYLRDQGLPALCKKYAVKATRHNKFPNLVLLKYDQLNSPMTEMIVRECRGLIVDEANHWNSVCVPFFKFFNINEKNAAPIDWETARVYEKLDGSLMSLYWYQGAWQVASSGNPDASGLLGNLGVSMGEFFWRTWSELGYKLPEETWRGTTFMFEFMTPWNRVVIAHERSRIALIGVRNPDFEELPPEEFSQWNWEVVNSFPLDTLEGVLEAASVLKPLESEGYVVRDAQFNRVKVKAPAYVALHHLRDSFTRIRLVEIVQRNESAEFLAYFPDFEPEYRGIENRFNSLVEATASAWNSLTHSELQEQKAFALAVKGHRYARAFFALRSGKAVGPRELYTSMPADRLLKLLDEHEG